MPKLRELFMFSTFNGAKENRGGKGQGITCLSRGSLNRIRRPLEDPSPLEKI